MCHMKAAHYGAKSSGPMKAKPKKIPKKEPVQPPREAHPCDCYTFSTIQAQKTTKKNTQKKPRKYPKKTWTRPAPTGVLVYSLLWMTQELVQPRRFWGVQSFLFRIEAMGFCVV